MEHLLWFYPSDPYEETSPNRPWRRLIKVRAFFSKHGVKRFNQYACEKLKKHPRLSVQEWGSDRGDKDVPRKIKGPDPKIAARRDQVVTGGVFELRRIWEEWIAEDRR